MISENFSVLDNLERKHHDGHNASNQEVDGKHANLCTRVLGKEEADHVREHYDSPRVQYEHNPAALVTQVKQLGDQQNQQHGHVGFGDVCEGVADPVACDIHSANQLHVFEILFAFLENEADDHSRNQRESDTQEERIAECLTSLGTLDEDPEVWVRLSCHREFEVFVVRGRLQDALVDELRIEGSDILGSQI